MNLGRSALDLIKGRLDVGRVEPRVVEVLADEAEAVEAVDSVLESSSAALAVVEVDWALTRFLLKKLGLAEGGLLKIKVWIRI